MTQLDSRYASFLVRIWTESSTTDADPARIWRGWAQHVRSGRSAYFRDMVGLQRFFEQCTGIKPPQGWPDGRRR